ncbi:MULTISPECIES: hypothetical protein [unclassified Sphingobacterium]|uniref:hypothetical protein n=1 Tax=unclassified Sphingobacterium TaxID=2609468 RepID=UPI001052D78E|nr:MULTISPECIES: hypothetical protein [unclassified Sphingobacterium]MCS3557663.1 hypothetical protein [Sphingobacterium sp. JUb21]TCQ95046.1 hypothetical protein EDF66_1325 [Sphingobacterium sp. JUb20]
MALGILDDVIFLQTTVETDIKAVEKIEIRFFLRFLGFLSFLQEIEILAKNSSEGSMEEDF